MHSESRDEIVDAFDDLDAALIRCSALSFDLLTTPERLNFLERLERHARRLPVARHQLINGVVQHATPAEIGGKVAHVLADRLHITRGEAKRRIDEASDLAARQALTGEPLPPRLPATAAGQRDGAIGADHVSVIRRFFKRLPCWVDVETREQAEVQLADFAARYRPDQLGKLADKLAECLNPDGEFSDEDRARRRGLTLGKQDIDGMSPLHGWLTPAARAALEAVLARLAAPGMANPYQEQPVLDGTPAEEDIQQDTRSPGQRNHDALHATLRAILASGKLGQHNGLPTSIIVTTTLRDLERGAGTALTGGGSLLPMTDVIRLARHAHHYLAIFDKGKAIGLYHTKRLASPGQRIVLHAKDRGCSRPGCTVPGYFAEVHHVRDWASCHETHIDNLTLCCPADHRLITPDGWTTRNRANGDTEWIPPPHLDHGQPRTNTFHHPERLLRGEEDEDADDHP